jgi:hypothetical protein
MIMSLFKKNKKKTQEIVTKQTVTQEFIPLEIDTKQTVTQEFIPLEIDTKEEIDTQEIISKTIEEIIKKYIIVKNTELEYFCLMDSDFLINNAERWKYNRNVNLEKVPFIIDHIKKNDFTTLDSVLYFYLNENKLICFDGNHRLESLMLLDKKIKILCYIIKTDVINDVITRFNIINSNTPIPDIYNDMLNTISEQHTNIQNTENIIQKKDVIEFLFEEYKKEYKEYYKLKPRKPHFNDTSFLNLCNEFEFNTRDELRIKLKNLNENNKKNIKNFNLSKTQKNKCEYSNLYLFI